MTTEATDPIDSTQSGLLKAISLIGLLLGVGLSLFALSSVVGIWVDLWDFRKAFSLLGMAHKYALPIAWVCVGISAVVIAGSWLASPRKRAAYTVLALLGAGAAWAAYLVPEGYRPPEGVNYPPIHDISTDRVTPPQFVAIAPLRADAPNPIEYGVSEGMTPEQLAALTEEAYPDLVTRRYHASVQATFDKAVETVESLGWELVAADASDGRIEATDTTLWFRFKDDVVIRIQSDGDGSVVDARSVSRVGRGDVGANAIRLRKFFERLNP